jgi:outer membrane protein assembly factor BamB
MYHHMSSFRVLFVALCTAVFAAGGLVVGAERSSAAGQLGIEQGILVLVGDVQPDQALELAATQHAAGSALKVFVQCDRADKAEEVARAAEKAGLYGKRIFVAKAPLERIGLADNLADALIVCGEPAAVPKSEILRVLRPQGVATVGSERLVKPFPSGVDDWSHHYHGPDNNTLSRDKLARAPFLTQFIVEPRYAPAPQMVVSSAGRIFMAFGHIAWHQREEPMLNTLVAINAFNGTKLWTRNLPPGHMVDRSMMVATSKVLYLADNRSCKLLDAATGKQLDEIRLPEDKVGGTFWKWIALQDGVLYGLIGPQEPADEIARWRNTSHGWPWNGISKGYNQQEYVWGFGNTLVALDPQSKQILWMHREEQPIDSRSLCMNRSRIFFCNFGKYLACLDAKTGKQLWRRTAEADPSIFEAIGRYRPGHGYIGGWKSTVYLRCTDRAIYFLGPQVHWLTALSAEDGQVLFKYPVIDLHLVIRDDGLYVIGPQNTTDQTARLDPLSGEVLARYNIRRRACTRSTSTSESIFFRGHEGTGCFSPGSEQVQWFSTMRPSCHVGVIVANGHLYWAPWACDCNLQMFGAICWAPAGDFAYYQQAGPDRLERGSAAAPSGNAPAPGSDSLKPGPNDWPTYRANNARTARSEATTPEKVRLLWQFQPKHSLEPTAPVAAGGLILVAADDGIVRALEAASGTLRWTACVGGPVCYPPAIAHGRAYVGSGDGWAYCLDAATGKLLWRFRAAPIERRIPVYDALMSTWPVASGVLVDGRTAYFAAGLTDTDGTHVYAVDALTGEIRWQNNTCGHIDPVSRRGVACQGDMLLYGDRLYLAGGNSVGVAAFDTATGKCFVNPPTGIGANALRGRELTLADNKVMVSGQPLYSTADSPVYDNSVRWQEAVVTTSNARLSLRQMPAGLGQGWWLVATSLDGARTLWTQPLPAEPVRWGLAVDGQGRIVVSLHGGRVMCFAQASN